MMQIGIVRARYHEEYTEEMLDTAQDQAEQRDITVSEVVEVPGAHDIPVAAKTLLAQDDIDGVAVLGIVIKGGTDHDDVIAYNLSKQLMELSCKHEKPVGFGVMGPNLSWAQAEQRTESYARQAVNAVHDTQRSIQHLQP